jgi:LytS/YehU family sensor histidine kinase
MEFFKRLRLGRPTVANLLIASFIIMTTIGGFLFAPPVGFIVCGVTSGLVGYLLGMD